MSRNWGLPNKADARAFHDAKTAKPMLTLLVSAVFGVFGAAVAAISFGAARDALAGLFHGGSLVAAVVAAGFGCWVYIWLARPRFAATFAGKRDAFSNLIRFYSRAAAGLGLVLAAGLAAGGLLTSKLFGAALLCMAGGAAAAAAFQTVLAFVPYYDPPPENSAAPGARGHAGPGPTAGPETLAGSGPAGDPDRRDA